MFFVVITTGLTVSPCVHSGISKGWRLRIAVWTNKVGRGGATRGFLLFPLGWSWFKQARIGQAGGAD